MNRYDAVAMHDSNLDFIRAISGLVVISAHLAFSCRPYISNLSIFLCWAD